MRQFGRFLILAVAAAIAIGVSVSDSSAMMGPGGSTGTGTTGGMMTTLQMPVSAMMFSYGPTTAPVIGTNITGTMPIGVGSVAMGGNMVTLHAQVGQFTGPMDMYLGIYSPAIDPFNMYLLHQDGTLQPVSAGVTPWMSGVTSIDQTPFGDIPTSMLPKGSYNVYFMTTPSGGNMSSYYFWSTSFMIQ